MIPEPKPDNNPKPIKLLFMYILIPTLIILAAVLYMCWFALHLRNDHKEDISSSLIETVLKADQEGRIVYQVSQKGDTIYTILPVQE